MIEIIRVGKTKFKVICTNCDALLSYTLNDLIGGSIRCPCCGEFCEHYNRIGKESEGEE